jgi:hypothetical protein
MSLKNRNLGFRFLINTIYEIDFQNSNFGLIFKLSVTFGRGIFT